MTEIISYQDVFGPATTVDGRLVPGGEYAEARLEAGGRGVKLGKELFNEPVDGVSEKVTYRWDGRTDLDATLAAMERYGLPENPPVRVQMRYIGEDEPTQYYTDLASAKQNRQFPEDCSSLILDYEDAETPVHELWWQDYNPDDRFGMIVVTEHPEHDTFTDLHAATDGMTPDDTDIETIVSRLETELHRFYDEL